jgi:hypothetical protein
VVNTGKAEVLEVGGAGATGINNEWLDAADFLYASNLGSSSRLARRDPDPLQLQERAVVSQSVCSASNSKCLFVWLRFI